MHEGLQCEGPDRTRCVHLAYSFQPHIPDTAILLGLAIPATKKEVRFAILNRLINSAQEKGSGDGYSHGTGSGMGRGGGGGRRSRQDEMGLEIFSCQSPTGGPLMLEVGGGGNGDLTR